MTSRYFVEPEGLYRSGGRSGRPPGPELWQHTDHPDGPALVLRKAELPGPYDELLWRVVTGVLAPDEATVTRAAAEAHNAGHERCDLATRRDYQIARAVLAALADPADTGGAA